LSEDGLKKDLTAEIAENAEKNRWKATSGFAALLMVDFLKQFPEFSPACYFLCELCVLCGELFGFMARSLLSSPR
jgi:hypothetical protein